MHFVNIMFARVVDGFDTFFLQISVLFCVSVLNDAKLQRGSITML